MTYLRVIPRDLFNESNLLKCVGKIVLLIEDGFIPWMNYEHDGEAFNIEMNESSGAIYIANIQFFANKKPLTFERPLNSRDAWPLYLETEADAFSVFSETGEFILKKEQAT